ncbi:hypothetical protein HDE_04018 [Halotydeus destructor]|nr:hypothetical protein HDE_04018 [Halotydeus destructor]
MMTYERDNMVPAEDEGDDEVVELRKNSVYEPTTVQIDDETRSPTGHSSTFRSPSTLERQFSPYNLKSPYRINFTEKNLYYVFKYTLLGFNGFLILLIIGGVFVYFTDVREEQFKLNPVEEANFLDESLGTKSGPKYAWLTSSLIFAMLLSIPCTGFIGALKDHTCLLILYGVIFFVEAIVCLIFKTFWFLFPAFISVAAIGLVFLRKSEPSDDLDHKGDHSTPFIAFKSPKDTARLNPGVAVA